MKISDRIKNISNFIYNPALMQRETIRLLKEVTDGDITIVDASNPFVFSLESSICNTVAFIQHNETINRKLYPIAAVDTEDLYLHMSDKDYIGRFALPSRLNFTLVFDKSELLNSLVLDVSTNIKKIIIPRNTVFTVGDTQFSLQYPIEIRELQHGGLQIVYLNDIVSPLYELETNIIDFNETTNEDFTKYIMFDVITHQFNIISKFQTVNKSSGFITKVPFSDHFYHARVYLLDSNNKWNEILTTHTQQIYNPNKATAVLQVNDKELVVRIPSIYTDSELVNGKMRIDLYQTKGKIDLNLSNYKISDFKAEWLNVDETENNQYSVVINNLKTIIIYSVNTTSGGRNSLSKDELMERVINNSIGSQNLPITNVQLKNSIIDAGYTFVKNIDTITNRVFLANKGMIDPVDNRLVTPASCSVTRITMTLNESYNAYGVNVSGNRVILTSDVLYQNKDGVVRLVSTQNFNSLINTSNSNRVNNLNSGGYFYSPFHYVLDNTDNTFTIRPYYLDNPEILTKNFVEDNPLSNVQVNISSDYAIEKNKNGYILKIKTKSNDFYKSLEDNTVMCQLAFKDANLSNYAYMLGELQTRASEEDERVFIFDMRTLFDINSNNQISQDSFQFNNSNVINFCSLVQEFQVFFLVNNVSVPNVNIINSDELVGKFQIPSTSVLVTHEKIKIRFGYFLDYLWARSKSISSSLTYKKHTEVVYAIHEKDVYDVDPTTGSAFDIVNGALEYRKIHSAGDPVLDSSNNPVVLFNIGDIMLDENGQPIVIDAEGDNIDRYIDIVTFDGIYRFTTDTASEQYKKSMILSMVDWIINDIPKFNAVALDQTRIFFYPKVTHGNVKCYVGNNKELSIPINQSFKLNLHVRNDVYNNVELKNELNRITILTINDMLNKSTISVSDIEYALKDKYKEDVIDVQLLGLGPNNEYNTITILDESAMMSIKKKLVLLPNNTIILEEDVEINYIIHDINA